MIRETYRGRKLTARKGREWGTALVTCNGVPVPWPTTTDLQGALDGVKAQVDAISGEPVNGDRWAAHWYAPGTYEMCPRGIHPQETGGLCKHFTCERDAAERAGRLGREHAGEGRAPLATWDEDEHLWPALGITSAVTDANAPGREVILTAYCEAYGRAAART